MYVWAIKVYLVATASLITSFSSFSVVGNGNSVRSGGDLYIWCGVRLWLVLNILILLVFVWWFDG